MFNQWAESYLQEFWNLVSDRIAVTRGLPPLNVVQFITAVGHAMSFYLRDRECQTIFRHPTGKLVLTDADTMIRADLTQSIAALQQEHHDNRRVAVTLPCPGSEAIRTDNGGIFHSSYYHLNASRHVGHGHMVPTSSYTLTPAQVKCALEKFSALNPQFDHCVTPDTLKYIPQRYTILDQKEVDSIVEEYTIQYAEHVQRTSLLVQITKDAFIKTILWSLLFEIIKKNLMPYISYCLGDSYKKHKLLANAGIFLIKTLILILNTPPILSGYIIHGGVWLLNLLGINLPAWFASIIHLLAIVFTGLDSEEYASIVGREATLLSAASAIALSNALYRIIRPCLPHLKQD